MFEGPIVVSAVAFAASFGFFNIYLVLLLSFLACTAGDLFWYFIGRFGRESILNKHFNKIMKSKNMIKIKKLLEDHYFRAIVLIKLVPPLPVPGLIFAGVDELKFKKFIFASLTVNLISSVVFVILGYYFGVFVNNFLFGNSWLIFGGALIFASSILIYRKHSAKIYRKIHRIR
jgi:membrane protein DedA with SNARE-associated domain